MISDIFNLRRDGDPMLGDAVDGLSIAADGPETPTGAAALAAEVGREAVAPVAGEGPGEPVPSEEERGPAAGEVLNAFFACRKARIAATLLPI